MYMKADPLGEGKARQGKKNMEHGGFSGLLNDMSKGRSLATVFFTMSLLYYDRMARRCSVSSRCAIEIPNQGGHPFLK